ncbi:CHRD domain-containing protein, partial [Escherichia coli]|uniref:CHRD domain-containing protein n=1 Tax=Escherichia coli TaxID=562 RepID=UPI0021579F80
VTSNATGEVKVFLNQAENEATVTGEFHNLSSAQTSARIEILVGTTGVFYNFPTIGGTNGKFPTAIIPVTAIQIAQLRTGLMSAVISSANNPNGEIRGQLTTHSDHSDFDGDGNSDFAVFRPSNGIWFTQNSQGINSQIIGGADDKIVSGDFD